MKLKNLSLITSALLAASTVSFSANATIVLFKTSMGDFEVNLFDNDTPKTVKNFLEYVEDGSYEQSFIHRNMEGFVVQGGGYTFNPELNDEEEMIGTVQIKSKGNVDNEPVFSNIRGTIAMAKLAENPDSATSQWFINVGDNASNLDSQNDGFTAFGTISAEGMEIIDAINELTVTIGGVPLQYIPDEDEYITNEHLVMIESITVTDLNTDTNPTLPPVSTKSESSGGGSMNLFMLCAFAAGACRRFFGK